MRMTKSYNGPLMKDGKKNEAIVMEFLTNQFDLIMTDVSEHQEYQHIEVDFIGMRDGKEFTFEIKGDRHIVEEGNLLFETQRINHHVAPYQYVGWGWRSEADILVVRNISTGKVFVFTFKELRKRIGQYVLETGKNMRTDITETDDQKTTFNLLIPMSYLKGYYDVYETKNDLVQGLKTMQALLNKYKTKQ